MGKSAPQQFDKYKKHYKDKQQMATITGANGGSYTWTSPHTNVPFPPQTGTTFATDPSGIEFGKSFDIAAAVITDPIAVKAAYQMALDSFFQAKADNFPTWEGLPEIKVNTSSSYGNALQGGKQIGWYAYVPKKYVLTEDDKIKKLDEELWDS